MWGITSDEYKEVLKGGGCHLLKTCKDRNSDEIFALCYILF